MPTIREYSSNFEISMDVDIDDFLYECSSREITEVIKWLEESDYIKSHNTIDEGSVMDIEWSNTVSKLQTLRQRLTLEEEELIKSIVNKY
jgi:ribosomal protein S8